MWTWNKSLLFLNWKMYIQPSSRKKSTKQQKGQWPSSGEFNCVPLMLHQSPVAEQRNHSMQVIGTPLFLIKCIITKLLNSFCSWREWIWSVQQPHSEVLPSGRHFMASLIQRIFYFLSYVLGNKGVQDIRMQDRAVMAFQPALTQEQAPGQIWSISKSLYQ